MLSNLTKRHGKGLLRRMATVHAPKKEGDISDAFISLSGAKEEPLPDRFRQLKCDLVRGKEKKLTESWERLLEELRRENEVIARKGPQVIPQVAFSDLAGGIDGLREEIKKRGAVVIKGVIPEHVAREYKFQVDDYVAKNPHTRAFPSSDNPQVFELYWSKPQLQARAHPSLLEVQRTLMSSLWHLSEPSAPINIDIPLAYADRVRVRKPGDASFSLGAHIDGGSVERWEPEGFGRSGVYDEVLEGEWEEYDAWDASRRVDAAVNLYDGLGACSMFRAWQGWLSMSHTRPGEGTLKVYPQMRLSMAYVLLRPFFEPRAGVRGEDLLRAGNWVMTAEGEMTSRLHGATPGRVYELSDEMHPHLELGRTMVHVPPIAPGDYVAWHCDTVHAVDGIHVGNADSSVMYIPVCPVTDANVEYLVRQRQAFRDGTPAPDFPGGVGESQHVGRQTEDMFRAWADADGRRAMGLERMVPSFEAFAGEREVVERANAMLGL